MNMRHKDNGLEASPLTETEYAWICEQIGNKTLVRDFVLMWLDKNYRDNKTTEIRTDELRILIRSREEQR